MARVGIFLAQKKLSQRMAIHRHNSKTHDSKLYRHVKKVGGIEHFKIVWLADFPCNRKEQLSAAEEVVMSSFKSELLLNEVKYRRRETKSVAKDFAKDRVMTAVLLLVLKMQLAKLR